MKRDQTFVLLSVAAVERLTDITVKHSVLELQSGGKN